MIENRPRKLIIWDFDGVISPTEDLWVKLWAQYLDDKYGLKLGKKEQDCILRGVSPMTKSERLKAEYDIEINKEDLDTIIKKQEEIMDEGLTITTDLLSVLNDESFAHCVATGGANNVSTKKIKTLALEDYFSIRDGTLFTSEMVKDGKPEPEMFLLAAKTMGYDPKDCFVIEDSLAGVEAGVKAGMKTVGFTKYAEDKNEAEAEMLKIGATAAFDSMLEVHDFVRGNR